MFLKQNAHSRAKTFSKRFFQKKLKIRIFDFEILFYGEKVTKLVIFYPCFFTKTHLHKKQKVDFDIAFIPSRSEPTGTML